MLETKSLQREVKISSKWMQQCVWHHFCQHLLEGIVVPGSLYVCTNMEQPLVLCEHRLNLSET